MVCFWASSPHILCISVFSFFVCCVKLPYGNTMFARLCFLRDGELVPSAGHLPSSFFRFLTVNINVFQFRYPCSFSVDGIRVQPDDVDSFLDPTVVLYLGLPCSVADNGQTFRLNKMVWSTGFPVSALKSKSGKQGGETKTARRKRFIRTSPPTLGLGPTAKTWFYNVVYHLAHVIEYNELNEHFKRNLVITYLSIRVQMRLTSNRSVLSYPVFPVHLWIC